jgi:hypothetical protein
MISFDFGIPYVAEKLTHFESAANVIINYPRQNYPCLTISQKEIKLVVEHLVKVHNKRKLIYISGNKGNFEAESRLSAFKESVAEYKIDFPPERLFYGNFSDMHCGEKTIDEALEVRHLDLTPWFAPMTTWPLPPSSGCENIICLSHMMWQLPVSTTTFMRSPASPPDHSTLLILRCCQVRNAKIDPYVERRDHRKCHRGHTNRIDHQAVLRVSTRVNTQRFLKFRQGDEESFFEEI